MITLFKASTRSVAIVHAACLAFAIIGAFFFEFTLVNICIAIVSFYVMNCVGMHMMMHRYFSHRYFKFKSVWVERFFTLIAILATRGSPLGWVYVHRKHHQNADTGDDPIGPVSHGYRVFGFYDKMVNSYESDMNPLLVKSLMNKEQLFINNYYWLIIAAAILPLAYISPEIVYFVYVLPVIVLELNLNIFNYSAHSLGYQNYPTKDDSKNNPLMFILNLGEAWHNNHHGKPGKTTTKVKWWEFDPVYGIMKMVSK